VTGDLHSQRRGPVALPSHAALLSYCCTTPHNNVTRSVITQRRLTQQGYCRHWCVTVTVVRCCLFNKCASTPSVSLQAYVWKCKHNDYWLRQLTVAEAHGWSHRHPAWLPATAVVFNLEPYASGWCRKSGDPSVSLSITPLCPPPSPISHQSSERIW